MSENEKVLVLVLVLGATYWKKRGWCVMLLSCSSRRRSLCSCSIRCLCSSAPSVSPSSSSLQGGGAPSLEGSKTLAPPAVHTLAGPLCVCVIAQHPS